MLILCILIMLFLNILVSVNIFKYIRYFTFMFHSEEYSKSKPMTYSEFIKFMKKK